MAVVVQCPNPACRVSCSVADAAGGSPVRCARCGKPFVVKPSLDGQKLDTTNSQPSSKANPFPVLPAEFGRYRVLRMLGQGGMGAVYLAEDFRLGRQVALKMPFIDAAESPQRVERFVREAQSAAVLHHANICTVFDAGQISGRLFITMAYIAGKPLADEIDPDKPMPQRRAAEIARKIALALAHAHGKGTVHRDLKPANVMMTADGEPVVTDFGLAKRVADGNPSEAKLTREGGIVGTPSYMSPEQVKGEVQSIGPATDVYSLGVLLFEMLTGKTPYTGSMGVVMGQILAAPAPPVRDFRADADSRLDAICRKAMSKEPAARFPSMAEFANALDQYLKASSSPPPIPAPLALLVPQARSPVSARSTFADMVEAPTPIHPSKKVKKGRAVAVWLALALLIPLSVWLAIVVLRVETPNGTLIVEMNDDEVEARIKNGKLILSGPDDKVRYTLTANDRTRKLEAGPYKIRVEGADGLELDTTDFTIRKGRQVTVRVRLERKSVVKKDSPGKPDLQKAGAVITNSIGMKLVRIPAGTFTMGEGASEHEVEITKAFYMGVYTVTQAEYKEVMGSNPSVFSADGGGKDKVKGLDTDRFPVEMVSWEDAKKYCEKLSALAKEKEAGREYRLPTEAEWEYACRASTKTKYHSGDDEDDLKKVAWYAANSGGRTHEVGTKKGNAWGLYDMHGNVWQWCADWYDGNYYGKSPRLDPRGPASGSNRVFRGGCWGDRAVRCAASLRFRLGPGNSDNYLGFRLLAVPSR